MKRADRASECGRAFRIFDRDGNGEISAGELRQVMANLERPLTAGEIEEIYKWLGQGGKEELGEAEFVQLLMGGEL